MIVLDAGVLIAHIDADDVFHEATVGFLEENEYFDFAASTLSVAESLVHATAVDRVTTVLSAYERLTLIQIEVGRADTAGVAEIRHASKLRMPDAVALYTAERHSADLVTTDRRLAAAAEARGVTAHLLER